MLPDHYIEIYNKTLIMFFQNLKGYERDSNKVSST